MSEELQVCKTPRLADLPPPIDTEELSGPVTVKDLLLRIAWDLASDNGQLRCRQRHVVTLTVEAPRGDSETFALNMAKDICLVDTKLREVCSIIGDTGRLPKPSVEGDRFVVTWRIGPLT